MKTHTEDDFVSLTINSSNYAEISGWLHLHVGRAGRDFEWVWDVKKTRGVRIFDSKKRTLTMLRWL